MTEVAAGPQPHRGKPAAERGDLEILDKVFHIIIERSTLRVPGVEPKSSAWSVMTRSSFPKIDSQVAGNRIRVRIDIAVRWPVDAATVARTVRSTVTRALEQMTGLIVDGVDVHIPEFVRDTEQAPRRVVL